MAAASMLSGQARRTSGCLLRHQWSSYAFSGSSLPRVESKRSGQRSSCGLRQAHRLSRLALLLLWTLVAWMPLVGALHIAQQSVSLSADVNAVQLAAFRFGGVGQLQFQLSSLDTPDTPGNVSTALLQNTTLVLIGRDDWSQLKQSIRNTEPKSSENKRDTSKGGFDTNFCQQWRKYPDNILLVVPFANLTAPIAPRGYTLTQPVRGTGDHLLLVLLCANASISWTSSIDMVNFLSDGSVTHLYYGLFPLPWIYLGFAAALWPLLCVIWLVHWGRHRKADLPLHRLLLSVALISAGLSAVECARTFVESKSGVINIPLSVIQSIFSLVHGCLLYATAMLISKGWCVTRRGLLRLESRIVWGTALFAAVADVFYDAAGEGAILAVGTMRAVMFMYLWLNFRHQQAVLAAHLYRLHTEQSPTEVMHAYVRKALLLFYAQRVIITFGLIAIAINFFTVYLLSTSSAAYMAHITPELMDAITIAWLGWLFRLRSEVPVDLSQTADPSRDGEQNDNNDRWGAFGTLFATSLPHARNPVVPTAPDISDGPQVLAGVGVAGVRERVFARLRRVQHQPTVAHTVTAN
ncbi:hypothetical protein THASP1DRAFT_32498 [Thamnocephalis sphaerospora]|uniref:Lung seven transmembrane receptor-domain-containing protein n=1 Tax=Thamnocephalis sphaerospora TaxID=78915 RepID=A0A4P9XIX6_9FUNG|nr:hypothetical protein THASP1DRAFT_32498 [Thamnocephalis sphaerospora]|eukprot:RKP05666.1 hypothetical protein THASP1DRAFT_32498 [Thamnocephalis sphaerospora]